MQFLRGTRERPNAPVLIAAGMALSLLGLAACSSTPVQSDATTEQSTSSTSQTPTAAKSEDAVAKAKSKQKVVYLTYDDGPAEDTKALLKVLKKHGAQATFFVVGDMAARNQGLMNQIHREGHYLGNHTWNHPFLPRLTSAKIRSELASTQRTSKFMGNCYRPPYGAYNTKVNKVAKSLGLKRIMWDIVTADWENISTQTIKQRILKAKPGDNILMHDGPAKRKNTVAATDQALEILTKRGFVAKGVPACSTQTP